ncbi:broad specificity phosphatase PhoE [Nocardioides daedukensis]|uniref:Broad specificity phosphatase PhoE n=1 Tax=Nocardioides daedukensis TaxID=634462 RepID=A0A7Y9S583_9ACTN|nr:histidine phosphatase family protein [Nocardioides daedukensis]NYG59645.1 broad specificity phosphatase PhoE [Nocardioides daedukensis]
MGQLLLVRHGQASWGADDYDVLSPLGWEQSRMLGQALSARALAPTVLIQGTMRRHRETAESVAAGAGWVDTPIIEDGGWDEFDHLAMLRRHPAPFGDREPTRAEFQEWFVQAATRWTSGEHDEDYDETFAAFADRVDGAIDRAAARVGSHETALVFTSGGPVAWAATSLVAAAGEARTHAFVWNQFNKVVVNSSLTKIVVSARGETLVSFNEHSHLEGDGLTYR